MFQLTSASVHSDFLAPLWRHSAPNLMHAIVRAHSKIETWNTSSYIADAWGCHFADVQTLPPPDGVSGGSAFSELKKALLRNEALCELYAGSGNYFFQQVSRKSIWLVYKLPPRRIHGKITVVGCFWSLKCNNSTHPQSTVGIAQKFSLGIITDLTLFLSDYTLFTLLLFVFLSYYSIY